MAQHPSRRSFLRSVGWGSVGAVATAGILNSETRAVAAPDEEILGADGVKTANSLLKRWVFTLWARTLGYGDGRVLAVVRVQ